MLPLETDGAGWDHAGAGHSMYNPGIQDQLLQATDRMRHLAKTSNSQQRQPTQRARELASK